jgi:hypothetical protein
MEGLAHVHSYSCKFRHSTPYACIIAHIKHKVCPFYVEDREIIMKEETYIDCNQNTT